MSERISRKNVSGMFDSIAPTYDLLNHVLSLGIDQSWRRRTVKMVNEVRHTCIADFATGTGDLAIALARRTDATRVVGLDFSPEMLRVAEKKIAGKELTNRISLQQENCEHTSLEDASVDVVTCAFGIRNFNDPQQGLVEMHRVLNEGGNVFVLEFATPRKGLISILTQWYYLHVMPFFGKLVARNKAAYTYLPKTIFEFAHGAQFCEMMQKAGFSKVGFKSFTFNMVNLYYGTKE